MRQRSDLAQVTLLQQATRPMQWTEWFEHVQVTAPNAMRGPRFEQFSMLAQAAANGLGVALVPRFLVEEELASQRLVALFSDVLRTENAYYAVTPETRADNKLVQAFRSWLVAEAAQYAQAGHCPARPASPV
jgi:LysR family glycine cleavage system transcriptional activator